MPSERPLVSGDEHKSGPDWPSDAVDWESLACDCHECRNSDERGCAVVMTCDGERVQCGLQGRHDGSCDYWEKPHDERGDDDD